MADKSLAGAALGLVVLAAAGTVGVSRLREGAAFQGAGSGPAVVDVGPLMPITDLYGAADIGKDLDWVQMTPNGKRKLFFQVLLPRTWEWRQAAAAPEQFEHDQQQPVPLLEAGPRGDEQALIEVRYARVPQEVSLARFVQGFLAISNYQVVAEQDRTLGGGKKVHDALLKLPGTPFGPTLTRMVVSRRGDLIFLVAGSSPVASFPRFARTFAATALSLDP